MSHKRVTQTNRIDLQDSSEETNSKEFGFLQDVCGLNVCLNDHNDLADFSSLQDENQGKDPHNFTSDQSKVKSDESKGDHETQESEGGEADLHKHRDNCKKNPGHRQFIPVDTFTLKHLPEGLQDNDLYEYIKVTADLTVRVNVTMSSPHRPEYWPKTKKTYPFYNMSERKNLRTGSGNVWFVSKYTKSFHTKKCWCRKCGDSDSPSNVWFEFGVSTAAHVIIDQIEASHTTLRLFYDRDESPVVSVDKVIVASRDIEEDMCWLQCVTCDQNVGNKLMDMWKYFRDVSEKVLNKYTDSSSKHNFLCIVSHPHGCSKQISVGQWKDRQKLGKHGCKLTYTTCTCPGSSGAHVHCLGYYDQWYWFNLVHSGSFKSGLNYSGVGGSP